MTLPKGTPIGRPWIVILCDGTIAIDWGDGLYQEAISGDFFSLEGDQVIHRAQDYDLDWLVRVGSIGNFDAQNAYFLDLPERFVRSTE